MVEGFDQHLNQPIAEKFNVLKTQVFRAQERLAAGAAGAGQAMIFAGRLARMKEANV